jgi:nicotinate-nucleotide pyrophosphorylase (carboxylating)
VLFRSAVSKAKESVSFSKKIEVEVTNAEDALQVAEAGADIIMLDNFPTAQLRKTCALLRKTVGQKRILIEASGGISSENIMKYASTGVDVVSLGEITDSPKALDISLEITKTRKKQP